MFPVNGGPAKFDRWTEAGRNRRLPGARVPDAMATVIHLDVVFPRMGALAIQAGSGRRHWVSPVRFQILAVVVLQVLIVSDQPLIALGLSQLISTIEPGARVSVAARWSSSDPLEGEVSRAALVVADLDLCGATRGELVERLGESAQSSVVLALTGTPSTEESRDLQRRCIWYVAKSSPAEELKLVMKAALGRQGAGPVPS